MERKGLSQEGLKVIACLTMLVDHIGATMVSGYWLRIIGRIAFPIYCFLLAEGASYTKNPKKYALRLLIGFLLSELPFDLAFRRKLTWDYQNVMLTLLLGFLAVQIIMKSGNDVIKRCWRCIRTGWRRRFRKRALRWRSGQTLTTAALAFCSLFCSVRREESSGCKR